VRLPASLLSNSVATVVYPCAVIAGVSAVCPKHLHKIDALLKPCRNAISVTCGALAASNRSGACLEPSPQCTSYCLAVRFEELIHPRAEDAHRHFHPASVSSPRSCRGDSLISESLAPRDVN